MAEKPDIEWTIGEAGSHDLVFRENGKLVDVSSFTGGTIKFSNQKDMETLIGSAVPITPGTPDVNSARFTIPDLTVGFTVGDKKYRDYYALVELTGAGTRPGKLLTVRIKKKLGDTT